MSNDGHRHGSWHLTDRQQEALQRCAHTDSDLVTAQILTMRSLHDMGLVGQPRALTAANNFLLTAALTAAGRQLLAEMNQ